MAHWIDKKEEQELKADEKELKELILKKFPVGDIPKGQVHPFVEASIYLLAATKCKEETFRLLHNMYQTTALYNINLYSIPTAPVKE